VLGALDDHGIVNLPVGTFQRVTVRRIVPNVFDADPAATRGFYGDLFGLETAMDMGWITTLVAPDNRAAQISIFEPDAEPGRDPFLSIEVSDVDAIHTRAQELGCEIVYSLRDEDWGVRRFMLRDPAGRVVNVLAHGPRGRVG
jgi:predicted enzyme related to lactoylglutathione lyase